MRHRGRLRRTSRSDSPVRTRRVRPRRGLCERHERRAERGLLGAVRLVRLRARLAGRGRDGGICLVAAPAPGYELTGGRWRMAADETLEPDPYEAGPPTTHE